MTSEILTGKRIMKVKVRHQDPVIEKLQLSAATAKAVFRAVHQNGMRAGLVALLLFGTRLANAQSYSVDWSKIAGGGGTSTGGVYSLSGTIGQPDAGGAMTNGQYSVTGGFWVLPQAVPVTGAPTLTIAPAASGNATVSWAPATPGFVLQESASLSPANWTNSPSSATNPVTVPAVPPRKFYRLFKP